MPVSESTSVDLPWSTWPAVATTCTGVCAPSAQHCDCLGDHRVVGRVHRAKVEDGPSRLDPSDDGRVVGPESGGMVAVEGYAGRRDGHTGSGARPRDGVAGHDLPGHE